MLHGLNKFIIQMCLNKFVTQIVDFLALSL